jgi:hypothetical protein
MKVYSLYDKYKTFLGAFPSRDMCISYAKVLHPDADGWNYEIVEEYLHKSTISYTSPYITSNAIPYVKPSYPGSPNVWCGAQDNMGTVTATYQNTGEQNA